MSEWEEVTLGEVADLLVGFAFKSTEFTNDDSGTRLLRGVNIGQGFLDWSRCAHLPEEDRVAYERYELTAGDVVLAMDRPWIEAGLKRARLRESDLPALLVQRVSRLRGTTRVHTSFLHHLLASRAFADYIKPIVTGVNVPHISPDQIKAFRFRLPTRSQQEAICGVLDSIDDLIENNRRRIALLEQMAQAVYREWFVHLRYPGHENDELVDSPLGPIPAGWDASDVGAETLNFDRLRKPLSQPERAGRPGPYPYYGAAKVIDSIDDFIFEGDYLLIAEDGSVITPQGFPVLQRVRGRFWVSNHAHVLQGAGRVGTTILEFALADYPIGGHVTGAAQPKITRANLNRIPLVVPSASIVGTFGEVADSLVDDCFALSRSCLALERMRESLLPKLVTGQIDVSRLDLDALLDAAA